MRTYYVHMNLTLSVDEKTVREARKAAESMGMSLNGAVRRFLSELAGSAGAEEDIAEMYALSRASGGDPRGWEFSREDVHERS